MSCCGQNRAFAKQEGTQAADSFPASAATSLKFVQRRSIVLRGPVTGQRYQFHDGAYTRGIDARDVTALLKSGYFQQPQ